MDMFIGFDFVVVVVDLVGEMMGICWVVCFVLFGGVDWDVLG